MSLLFCSMILITWILFLLHIFRFSETRFRYFIFVLSVSHVDFFCALVCSLKRKQMVVRNFLFKTEKESNWVSVNTSLISFCFGIELQACLLLY